MNVNNKGTMYRFEDVQKEASKIVFEDGMKGSLNLNLNNIQPMELKNTKIPTVIMLVLQFSIGIFMIANLYKVYVKN